MKITAEDLLEFEIAEKIIEEPEGGAHLSLKMTAENIAGYLEESIMRLGKVSEKSMDALLEKRYEKFRKIGVFDE